VTDPKEIRLSGPAPILHPLCGCSLRQFWRHWAGNLPYGFRTLHSQSFALGAVLLRQSAVLRERFLHGKAIEEQRIEGGPVFVVGHWRSGTTFLHNLLSLDPRFGTISFSESAMPLDYLSRFRPAHDVMRWLMPRTRGVDAVEIGIDTPQEEEMALAAIGDVSFYLCFYFPRRLEEFFRKSVLLEGLSPLEIERLREHYRFLARKVAYAQRGERVLFKNPACTTRLRFLKETFPEARFVHIVRDPFAVYPSMLKLWMRLLEAFSWQDPSGIDFAETTLSIYERTMGRYLEEREGIPREDLHEVRFEDLESDPWAVLSGIYEALGIDWSEEAREAVGSYLEAHADYRKNAHELDAETRSRIAERWGFALEEWGYG